MTTKKITGTLTDVEFTDKQIKVSIVEPGQGSGPSGGRYPSVFGGFLDQVEEKVQVALKEAGKGSTWCVTVVETQKLNQKGNPYLNLVTAEPTTIYQDDAERSMEEDFVPTATQPGLAPNEVMDPRGPMHPDLPQGEERTYPPYDSREEPFDQPPFTGKPDAPESRVEGMVQGHLEKLAVSLYLGTLTNQTVNDPINYTRIREIRDGLFHQVKEKLIQPEHYCYQHETPFNLGGAGYGHRVENGWHMEDGRMLDSEGKAVE